MMYWGKSFPSRLYIRVIMAFAAFLWTGIFAGALNLPVTVQFALAGAVCIFVLFFRMIVPNGFSKFTMGMTTASDQARAELADGNFDGVPDFIQKSFPYPTNENDGEDDGGSEGDDAPEGEE